MSTGIMGDANVSMSRCAACGDEGGDGVKLKTCNACKMVKYCNAQCQKAHRPSHKKECRKRAAELLDEKLFEDPPPPDDCPVCFLPLPLDISQSRYQSCCSTVLCIGCTYAVWEQHGSRVMAPCPFCRTPNSLDDDDHIQMTKKRAEANDPEAYRALGNWYYAGKLGMQQDSKKAFELWSKAAELGSVSILGKIGDSYQIGRGVEKDTRKAIHYWQLAAMGGDVFARYNLGVSEYKANNFDRSMKHFMIAAGAGCNGSLERIKEGYMDGDVTKADFANALRAHKASVDEMRSDQRDKAARNIVR